MAEAVQQSDRGLNLKEVQENVGPWLIYFAELVMQIDDVAIWAYEKGCAVWEWLEPYHPDELIPVVVGILLVFFGGTFAVLIQAIEAARLFGFEKVFTSLKALAQEFSAARKAYERDDMVDADKDGVADVKQMDKKQLAARKLGVILRAVDPQKLATALEGLTQAWIAIIATLRIKFAQAITLGTSIGNTLHRYVTPFVLKFTKPLVPREYARWLPVILQYTFRYIGVSIAFWLVRIVSALFMGMKGAELFTIGLVQYFVRHGQLSADVFDTGSPILSAGFAVIALFGAWWQISRNFSLPFPLNILLLPLSIAERVLMFAVGSKGLPGAPVEGA
uniref:Uncharacterized protein n=1 Tax=Erythrolobus madagascarensis TaxID=708628 RepID=A0A7S0T5G8_9RHOD|mmetsp:Transcript_131/g.229  ORF Transcript_131/g.229 Transcript_131/m.229 type:complete len:334 (+) Transcript_131:98-1099(+)